MPSTVERIQQEFRDQGLVVLAINLGQDRMITINQLVDMVARIAGKRIYRSHDLTKPQGVRGRNSDNTRLRQVLGWEPPTSLEAGLERTYKWIEEQLGDRNANLQPAAAASA